MYTRLASVTYTLANGAAHTVPESMFSDFGAAQNAVLRVHWMLTLADRCEDLCAMKCVKGRFDIWKLRAIMALGTLSEWNFHHVPMFATRARSVTEQSVAAARRGVTLYEPE